MRTPRNRAMRTLLVRLAVTLGTPHGIALVTHPRRVVLVLVAALPSIVRQDRQIQYSCRVAFAWHGLPLFAAPLRIWKQCIP